MTITAEFIQRFEQLVGEAEGSAARFEITGIFQKLSSLEPLYRLLKGSVSRDLTWDSVKSVVARIPVDKQRKYAAAIKHVQKFLEGHGSHMFETLKQYATKLSKSQQRYLIPMLSADSSVTPEQRHYADTGLCLNLTVFWLKEQFIHLPVSSFPRLNTGNVMASQPAYESARDAAKLVNFRSDMKGTAAGLGLKLEEKSHLWPGLSFHGCPGVFVRHPELQALLIVFFERQHTVALVRENAGNFLFFDVNAGSYRVPSARLQEFLVDYNNVCLPKKWPATPAHPAYHDPATELFNNALSVTRLAR